MKTIFTLLLIFLFSVHAFAQDILIDGTIVSTDDNMPVPGVNVIVKGTTRGVSTDFDGNYSINVNRGETLEFSFLGFISQSVTIQNQTTVNVSLVQDIASLDEVVVIGYGSQKKADLTGAISTIKAEDIEKTPNSNVMQSLQGKVAGLQVTSSGSPGDSPTVRIRGVSSYNNGDNTNPLYVVDGMFYDNIDFLDNSQIETVSVLKDASSVAIFGQKGVNGVIIIETKTGKFNQKPIFTYNGYTGFQAAQNVVKLANAEQFVTMAYESGSDADIQFVENAMQRYGRSRVNPNIPDVNTDWYKEVLRVAPIMSHSIGVSGGGESVTYGVSTNYFSQDGILDMKNDYERFNIQSNVDVKLSERLKMGTNAIFSNATKYNAENGAWFQAYFAVPILPVYDELNINATPIPFSDATQIGYRSSQNPFPVMRFNDNQLKIRKILASLYLEYSIIPDKLAFKTSYRHDYSTISERNVRLPYFISGNSQRETSTIIRQEQIYSNQIWDNTLTFKENFGDHNVTLLVGSSYRDEQYNKLKATGKDIQGIGLESSWYLDFADPTSFSNQVEEIGDRFYALGYFGRLEYNYKSKYLLNATVRREGDAKFPKEIWVTTPTVGVGWVISGEDFMQDNGIFDFLKIRASWGQLANGALGGSAGTRTVSQVTTDIGDVSTNGIISSSNFTDLEREILEETNIGISARMFQNKLSLEADYYIRDTKKLVIPVDQPIVSNTVLENVGEMRNKGLEISANWNQSINDNWNFSISGNIATLDNEVTKINSASGYFDTGQAEFRQRSMVGEPIEAFFGWEVVGVYQNDTEVQNDPIAVANNLVPGDLIFKDTDEDGDIDADDRVVLGSYLPSFSYGGNFQVSYKNFDFSLAVFGQTGNEILNRKRGEVLFTNDTNMDADLAINRWHGEGTSNSYPSSAGRRKLWNQKMSTFFVEDGSFFRIQNIQLAYTIPSGALLGKNMPETKITFTAERPFTSFKYNGFNPEVADGIDRQTYPVPAIYTVGVNIKI
ncbi:TonB-linked outer membrane protein, SusC/RagA family [Flaviramulus basaltis]|uniref:TonB-linked outer membrane protein, SusC/RagA family n=1 Tax=Flaviramulus basaltis TaxID=369401 RepID=A0A1K2IRH8_9FLAO|nr:SusC/RagA family TonB-linked outer membrane protein [Flaviramulus basaltis]SFZ94323.1 TonB-linked outer membrane protein, SusC/RagA family [Flaviramulus basaltis]